MAISGISLSESARSNLVSLQQTTQLLNSTEDRLASGKKVNSAIDNASAFFKSQSFLNRASDLSELKDGLSTALQSVKAASNAITAITSVVKQLQGLANDALQKTNSDDKQTLATQFNSLRDQLDGLVDDATFNGVNLLTSAGELVVKFNEDGSSTLTISGVDLSADDGLGIDAATDFGSTEDINTSISQLSTALNTLRTTASTFGTNATLIQTRSDFTTSLVNILQVASDKLVLADTNEEGANLQALQARSQLGIAALGISGQQQSAILRLF
ncbi:MAG: flagellin [Alphaproteobacteria bacterium]